MWHFKNRKRKRFSSEISSKFMIIQHIRKEKGKKSNSSRNILRIRQGWSSARREWHGKKEGLNCMLKRVRRISYSTELIMLELKFIWKKKIMKRC